MPGPGIVLAALLLLLATSACSAGDDDAGRAGGSGAAPSCDVLGVDDVRRATGLETELDESGGPGGSTECAYRAPGAEAMEPPVATVLLDGTDVTIDDLAGRVRGGSDEETRVESVDLEGADEAAVLTDSSFGFDTVWVLALGPEGSYAVGGSGASPEAERETGLSLMTLLLGGEVEEQAPVAEAGHPCEVLTAAEVGEVLGEEVVAERDAGVDGSCDYATDSVSIGLLSFGRGASVVDLAETDRADGAEVTEFEADGFEEALVAEISSDDAPPSVAVYLATPSDSYQLRISAGNNIAALKVARGLLPRIAG